MAALFIAQMIGMDLSVQQQLMVVLTSIIASGRRRWHSRSGSCDDDHGVYCCWVAGRIHSGPAHGGLVSRSLSHGDQRHGRYERQLSVGWEAEGGGLADFGNA